ncbi:MAG TPA: alpha/beta fold hydrolase [Pyrinomonadaceae bacterium]|jgi:pimeloyl-ACP methyl ester carboxylesterase
MAEKRGRKTGYAEVAGARFYYELAGEGTTLVLVHAGITDGRMWDEQFNAFAEHYRVLRYDRRGFGRTETGTGHFSHHQDLYELLKFLSVEEAYLVGCSQVGKTILNLALEHAPMVRALVLVASAVGGFTFAGEPPLQLAELEEAEARGDVARVNELELQIWVDGPRRTPSEVDARLRERVREMNLIALSATSDSSREKELEPAAARRLDEIRVPTLVIVGDLDTPKTLAAADLLVEKIDGAQKVLIRGTAHLPNMERPGEFNRRVLEFLKSLD